jgi:hypothetical protein
LSKNGSMYAVNVTHLLLIDLDKGEPDHANGDRCLREGGSTPGSVVELKRGGDYQTDSCRVQTGEGSAV